MKGFVDKLYNIEDIIIPQDMLNVEVDEQAVADEVNQLSIRFAKKDIVDKVQKGDLVCCRADEESYPDKRTIMLFTGAKMPGAEKASEDVLNKSLNDTLSTQLVGKDVTLTIEKIVRSKKVEVDDALISNMKLEGVTTVEQYKEYIRNKIKSDILMEKSKEVIQFVLNEMEKNCTYSYDKNEMDEYVKSEIEAYKNEMSEAGMEMEDDIEYIEKSIESQEKQLWIAKAFCKNENIFVDTSDAEEQADQMVEMMEMMGESVPSREKAIEMAVNEQYSTAFFMYIDKFVQDKLGGSNGNS